MISRRQFFLSAAVPMLARAASLTPKERIDRVLNSRDVDRLPYTCWYHFLDEKQSGKVHAENTLGFHRKFRTDLIKVMSDYPYPKPPDRWYELKPESNPFPEQIRALEILRGELNGKVHYIETIFNPWNYAEKLSSKEEVQRMKKENPQVLLDALQVIAQTEVNHAKRAIAAGASGIFLAIANAGDGITTPEEYTKFSQPFDRMVLDAVRNAPLNTLHIHGEKVFIDRFYQGWPATVLNYSTHATGVGISQVRAHSKSVILGGVDERKFRSLDSVTLKRQMASAEAGKRYIVGPGCSVPNDSADAEILRLTQAVGA